MASDIYNAGSSASPPEGLGTPEFSAAADANYGVQMLYKTSGRTVNYVYRPSTGPWAPISADIFSGTALDPVISVDYSTNDVYAFALQGSWIIMKGKAITQSWSDRSPVFPVTDMTGNPVYLSSSYATASGTASGRISLVWTNGTSSAARVWYAGIPILSVWSPFASPTDPWDGNGIVPYGQYFANLGESVSPSTGMLTVRQTDLGLAGRGLSLDITRVYVEPSSLLGSSPYNYENYPWVPMGNGWELNFPWMNSVQKPLYLHLTNGQGYRIPSSFWNSSTTSSFENHLGENFKMIRNSTGVFLYDKSGVAYSFDNGNSNRLVNIADPMGNTVHFVYDSSNRISCTSDTVGRGFNFIYANGLLQSISQIAGNCGSGAAPVRTVHYTYAGTNLANVTDPAGRSTSFNYDASRPWLLTRINYPTHWYTSYSYTSYRLGTENLVYSYRVTQQNVVPSAGPTIRSYVYSYTQGTGDEVTAATVKTFNGTSTQPASYTDYAFSFAGMTMNVSDGNHNLVRGLHEMFGVHGSPVNETVLVTDGNSPPGIGSYTNTYRYDSWGDLIYSHVVINPSANSYHDSFNAYYNDELPLGFYYFADTFSENGGSGAENLGWTMDYACSTCAGQTMVQSMSVNNGWLHFNVVASQGVFNFYSPRIPISGSYSHWTVSFNWKAHSDKFGPYVPNLTFSVRGSNSGITQLTNLALQAGASDQAGSYSADLSGTIDFLMSHFNDRWVELAWGISGESVGQVQTGDVNNVMVSPGTGFSSHFYNNTLLPSIHGALAGRAEFQNGTAVSPIEDYYNYSPWGGLTQAQRKYNSPTGTQWLTASRTYDSFGNLKTLTDPRGNVTSYEYSPAYQSAYLTSLSQTLSPGGALISRLYSYNFTLGTIRSSVNPYGYNTTYQYDILGRETRVTYQTGDYASYTYNDAANYVNITNENTWKTRQTYDGLGRLAKVERFSGGIVYSTELYNYNWMDKVTTQTDPLGNKDTYQYDLSGRQIQLRKPDGNMTLEYYNDTGSWVRVTDEGGIYRCNVYDRIGHLVSVVEEASFNCQTGIVTNYYYDEVGNLRKSITSVSPPQATTYTYDNLSRLILTKYPDKTNETYAYDNNGNLVRNVDRNGNLTIYSNDSFNRVSTVTYSGSGTTISHFYTYDKAGNLLQLQSQNATIGYTYDSRNRVTLECYYVNTASNGCPPSSGSGGGSVPAGTLITLANGTLTQVQNVPLGAQVIVYNVPTGYQTIATVSQIRKVTTSSLLTIHTSAGLPFRADANPLMKLWVYTTSGAIEKPITMIQSGDQIYNYDLHSWVMVTNVTVSYGGQHVMYDLTPSPAYTSNGLLLEYIANGYPDCYNFCKQGPSSGPTSSPSAGVVSKAYTVSYTYSGENLYQIKYPSGNTYSYAYDNFGRVANVSKSGMTYASFTYYPNDQVKTVAFGNGLAGNYSYDAVSRVSHETLSNGIQNLLSLTYGYNMTGTVTSINGKVGSSTISQQYTYDAVGRLTGETVGSSSFAYWYDSVGNRVYQSPNSLLGTSYQYNQANNELTSAGNGGGTTYYHYDLNGDLVLKTLGSNSWSYNWDVPGHMVRASSNSAAQGFYAYDGIGRRVESVESSTAFYAYLGTETLSELYVNGTINDYVYAGGFRIARLSGTSVFYYHTDALGSTRLVTDANKNVIFSDSYWAFGQDTGTLTGSETYKFTGKPVSQATGLYYDHQRWYDPSIGRFISTDPVRGKLSNPESLNLYIYVLDLPTSLIDPSGFDACDWNPTSWGGCFNNASQGVNNWWSGLSPEQQELITLTAFALITVATGGIDLLVVGAIGFALGAGIYAGATLATGGTPTLRGALFWGTIGFMAATAVASLPTIGPRIMSTLGLGGAEALGETATETAINGATAKGIEIPNPGIRILGYTEHALERVAERFGGGQLTPEAFGQVESIVANGRALLQPEGYYFIGEQGAVAVEWGVVRTVYAAADFYDETLAMVFQLGI